MVSVPNKLNKCTWKQCFICVVNVCSSTLFWAISGERPFLCWCFSTENHSRVKLERVTMQSQELQVVGQMYSMSVFLSWHVGITSNEQDYKISKNKFINQGKTDIYIILVTTYVWTHKVFFFLNQNLCCRLALCINLEMLLA